MNTKTQDPKLEQILGYARDDAGRGMVSSALRTLDQARAYAAKFGDEIPEATLTKIEETAYRRGVETVLEYARDDASRGIVIGALRMLNQARDYAAKVGVEIPEAALQEVEQTAYRNGVETALGYARDDAGRGMVSSALRTLDQARAYAAKISLDITDRVQKIEVTLKK